MLPINLAGHKSRQMQSEQKIINQLNYTDMKKVIKLIALLIWGATSFYCITMMFLNF